MKKSLEKEWVDGRMGFELLGPFGMGDQSSVSWGEPGSNYCGQGRGCVQITKGLKKFWYMNMGVKTYQCSVCHL